MLRVIFKLFWDVILEALWQLFIALKRIATILCNQGAVFWGSWTPAFSFSSSIPLYGFLKIGRPEAKWSKNGGEERSKFQEFYHPILFSFLYICCSSLISSILKMKISLFCCRVVMFWKSSQDGSLTSVLPLENISLKVVYSVSASDLPLPWLKQNKTEQKTSLKFKYWSHYFKWLWV